MKRMANVLIMIFLFCVIWGIGDSFFNESNNEEVDINIENIDILSKKMEVLLESNQFKYFSYQRGERAICVYEGTYDSELLGCNFAVYKETLMKDIVFVNMLIIEADTYNIYTWNGDCLTYMGVIEKEELELNEVSEYDDSSNFLFGNIKEIELLDYVMDVLAENGFNNLKLMYDGDCEFINRKYHLVSSFNDFEDHIIREETFYIDMENGNIYQASENDDYLRTELQYLGSLKIFSNQISITGEIYEETKQLNPVIIENWDIIEEFLRNYQKENKAVMISAFDFTGDGIEEIIVSKIYLATVTAPVSYNYVFDSEGEKILEFTWSYPADAEIYTIKTSNGKEKFYLTGYMDFAAHNNLWIYGEIFYDGKELNEEVVFMEWDTRYEIDRNNNVDEGHFVFYKPKEADDVLWQGYEGIALLSKTEKTVNPDMLREYIEKQNIIESKETVIVGCILYENNQFIWEPAQ